MEYVGEYVYNKKDLIGHGAFAMVFKGQQKKDRSKSVAIKCIGKKNFSKSYNVFHKEIKILKEISNDKNCHPNVVSLLDCVESPTQIHLVMEYCNGGDLADYLHARGTLSEDTLKFFLKQTASALKFLHTKGIVHRDLKPQNIFLSHPSHSSNSTSSSSSSSSSSSLFSSSSFKINSVTPSEIILKIGDFGFARFLEEGLMAGTLCGSPMYMAPEVLTSQKYGSKADLWSVGTIGFQCLTGKPPFTAKSPKQLKQLYEKFQDMQPKIPENTSPLLRDLLLGLLRQNSNLRISFDDFFNHPFLNQSMETSINQSQFGLTDVTSLSSSPLSNPPIVQLAQMQDLYEDDDRMEQMNETLVGVQGLQSTISNSLTLEDFVIVDKGGQELAEGSNQSNKLLPPTSSDFSSSSPPPLPLPVPPSSLTSNYFSTFPRRSETPLKLTKTRTIPCPPKKEFKIQDFEMKTSLKITNSCSKTCPNMVTMVAEYDNNNNNNNNNNNYNNNDDDIDGENSLGRGINKRSSLDVSSLTCNPLDLDKLIAFKPNPLSEDCLLDSKHNEIMSKLEFIQSLIECINQLISSYEPFSDLSSASSSPSSSPSSHFSHASDIFLLKPPSPSLFPPSSSDWMNLSTSQQKQLKQLLLLLTSLQYLLPSFQLASSEISLNNLKPTSGVKSCLKKLRTCYKECLQKMFHLFHLLFLNRENQPVNQKLNNLTNKTKTNQPQTSTNQQSSSFKLQPITFESQIYNPPISHESSSLKSPVSSTTPTTQITIKTIKTSKQITEISENTSMPSSSSSSSFSSVPSSSSFSILTYNFETLKIPDYIEGFCSWRIPSSSPDKILFSHALFSCQIGSKEELFGNSLNSIRYYHKALLLLHCLFEKEACPEDQKIINKYKSRVEKRLKHLTT